MAVDEKKCPRCAEMVKAQALVCRHCGHSFKPKPMFTPGALGCLGLIGFVGLMMMFGSDDKSSTPIPAAPSLTREQRQGCGKALAEAQRTKVIRQRPSPNRVNVDDLIWSQMAATDKEALLALLACDALGKRAPELTMDEPTIVAYGFRSGKRVGMLTQVGASFD